MTNIKKEEFSDVIDRTISAARGEIDRQIQVSQGEKRRMMFDAIDELERSIRKEIRRACSAGHIKSAESLEDLLERFNAPYRLAVNSTKFTKGKEIFKNAIDGLIHGIRAEFPSLYLPGGILEKISDQENESDEQTPKSSFVESLSALSNMPDDEILKAEDAKNIFVKKLMNIIAENFIEDFLKDLGKIEGLNVFEKFAVRQIEDLNKQFKRLKEYLAKIIRNKIEDNPDISFNELAKYITAELKNYHVEFIYFPETADNIFKERIIKWLSYFLNDPQPLDQFWIYSHNEYDESFLTEQIHKILLSEKYAAVEAEDSEDEDVIIDIFPYSKDEIAFIKQQYEIIYKECASDDTCLEKLKVLVNNEFHGGLELRDTENIETILLCSEEELFEEKAKTEEVAQQPAEISETEVKVADESAETAVEEEEVSDPLNELSDESVGPEECYEPLDQESQAQDKIEVVPEPAEPVLESEPETNETVFKAEPETQAEISTELEPESEPEFEVIAEIEIIESEKNLKKDVEDLINQMGIVAMEFEKRLANMAFLRELFKMRQGLIEKISKYHEMRSPDIEEMEVKKEIFMNLISELEKIYASTFALLSELVHNQKRMSRNSISLKQPHFFETLPADSAEDLFEELNSFLNDLDALNLLWVKVEELSVSFKMNFQWFAETVKKIQIGDRFFDKGLAEFSMGADAKLIAGVDYKNLFEKDQKTDDLIREMNEYISDFNEKYKILDEKKAELLPGLREKVEEGIKLLNERKKQSEAEQKKPDEDSKNDLKDEVKADTAEKASVEKPVGTERGKDITVTLDNESITLSRLQLDALLIVSSYNKSPNIGDGLSKPKIEFLLPSVFPERLIEEFDLDSLSEFDEDRKKRGPGKDERAKCRKIFIRWRMLNGKLKYLPTHKAYRILEQLSSSIGLTEEQIKIIADYKAELKAKYITFLNKKGTRTPD